LLQLPDASFRAKVPFVEGKWNRGHI